MASRIQLKPLNILLAVTMASVFLYFWFLRPSARLEKRIDLNRLLVVSVEAAERGGLEVVAVRRASKFAKKSKGQTLEGVDDPLTEGDMRSNRVMSNILKREFSDIKLISEEHDSDEGKVPVSDSNYPYVTTAQKIITELNNLTPSHIFINNPEDLTLWIDPLDATLEYSMNLTEYVTTMVCVAYRGKPLIGVIHRPFHDQTFWGWNGVGTSKSLSDLRLVPSSDPQLKVIVSMSHKGAVETFVKQAAPEVKVIEGAGAGYKVSKVLDNTAQAYVHTTAIKKWDICAGNAILLSVGGRMTTLTGEELSYDPQSDVKNNDGLLATVTDDFHQKYLGKFRPLVKPKNH